MRHAQTHRLDPIAHQIVAIDAYFVIQITRLF
jgi:hypothetical protein